MCRHKITSRKMEMKGYNAETLFCAPHNLFWAVNWSSTIVCNGSNRCCAGCCWQCAGLCSSIPHEKLTVATFVWPFFGAKLTGSWFDQLLHYESSSCEEEIVKQKEHFLPREVLVKYLACPAVWGSGSRCSNHV